MPNRILREGILTSPRMAQLDFPAEVFFRRLMSVVDDFGRYYADHGMLRAACYPRQLDKVSDADIGKWLASAQRARLVRVYQAQDGERYLEVLDFGQQVRAKKSKFPNPDSTCAADAAQTIANEHLDVFVSVDVDECVSAAPTPAPKRKQKTELPPDFAISDRVKAWAAEKGFDRLADHLDAFRRKCAANTYRYADWDSAFMEAVREDWAKLRGRAPNGAAPPATAQASESVEDYQARMARERAEDRKGTTAPPAGIRELAAKLRIAR